MSSPQRRAEMRAKYEQEEILARKEQARKDALCMYDRIAESDASSDVKDILHRLAEELGLE